MTVTAPARGAADAAAAAPAIVCRGLSKTYGSVQALRSLDLEVPAGSVFGLLGPNGAGKTTLLHLLTGLRRPTAGEALIDGVPIGRAGASVGYLDQDPRYYGWMTGAELLGFAGTLCGLRGADLAAAVAHAAELAGVAEFMHRRLGGYSGGMRQRLGIAQAIVHRPRVLLLDEPVSSLDPEGRRDVLEVIARLRGSATVLVSTHILADVERVCDRVAILDHGRLLAESEIGVLLERHAAPAYEVELRDASPEQQDALVERLARQPWAAAVESGAASRIRVQTSDADAAGRELIAELAAAGVAVDRLQRVRPSLEDVFLSIVEGGPGGEVR
ncbi:MAG TPA: ABC transporter ATP-binding protein [Candidatus Dormibacteraeota bacterium]|nr:ABC transporter ATP-binding protein [Candidatus Dormibacteraeota bacterium]